MEKIKLYLDFDGVILDTINETYRLFFKKYGIDLKTIEKKELDINQELITNFYSNLDWNRLVKVTPQINNSIANIHKLIASNLYDVEILTHVNSESEGNTKIAYLNELIPGIKVIPTPKVINKCDMVNPYNCVLIDDFTGNLSLWEDAGGISVKFSDSGKISQFITITSLSELLNEDIYLEIKNKLRKPKIKEKRV